MAEAVGIAFAAPHVALQTLTPAKRNEEGGQDVKKTHSNDHDGSDAPPKYARGQPRVAGFMACGSNLAIFRKFDRMAYISILHQQNQLLDIERKIDEMDARDEDLINLVPELRRYLSGTNKIRPPKETHVTLDDFYNYYSKDSSSRAWEPQEPEGLEADGWVEVILKQELNGSGLRLHQPVIVRGRWDYRKTAGPTAFSVVFLSDRIEEAPVVVWQEYLNRAPYPLSANWEFQTAHYGQSEVHLQILASIGNRFEDQLTRYCSQSMPNLPQKVHSEATVRLFLRHHKSPPLAFLVCSSQSGMTVRNLDTRQSKKSDQLREDEARIKGFPNMRDLQDGETLLAALESLARQRNSALRDGLMMAKSVQREDLVRVGALNRLERKLASYRNALVQQAQMARFEAPNTRGMTTLRRWFWGKDKNHTKPQGLPLQGLARDIYTHRKRTDDLVALGPPARPDMLSRAIDWMLASRLKKRGVQPMQDLGETYFYSEAWIAVIVSWVGVILAAGLLIGAIVGLDQLEDKAARMGTICALTVAFALVLFFTTTSTRGEIFGASAAYAAVLVVYVGGALDK